MSINDPILEALSFTLENDLSILTEPKTTCSSSDQVKASTSQVVSDGGGEEEGGSSGVNKGVDNVVNDFEKSSVLLGEEERTTCPFPGCDYWTEDNVSSGDKKAQGELLAHLLGQHRLVIDNCDEVANLTKYLAYWKGRFASGDIAEFCVGFKMEEPPKPPENKKQKKPGGGDEEAKSEEVVEPKKDDDNLYFMLSPALPEDSQIRKELWKQRLNTVLEVNRQEREDTSFSRRCLFCRDVVSGNRTQYFLHMRDNHSFHIGQPDNLVFVKELLKLIEDKLNRLECLFCEHIFKDKAVLKEHMRKKQHRKINPKNHEYDRFYVVNYLEPGKTWEMLELEEPEDERKEDEWLETPEEKERNIVCLFCKYSNSSFQLILEHMKKDHYFDFAAVSASFDFYQKVKLINYIRRTVYQNMCLSCDERLKDPPHLLSHISEHKINGQHELLPKTEDWNQPEYFFPTYEEDDFLTCLDTGDVADEVNSVSSEDESKVIPEDLPHIDMKNRDFDLAGFAIKFHNQKHN